MRADPTWQDQAAQSWRGHDPRYAGYEPGAGRAGGPWPDEAGPGYQHGAPPPRGYGHHDQFGDYEAAHQALSDKRQARRPGDPAAGDEQAVHPADRRMADRPSAGQAARVRKSGPPAALPPGPSASGGQAAGPAGDAAGRDAASQEPGAPGDQDRRLAESGARPAPPAGQAADQPPAQPERQATEADEPGDGAQSSAVTAATPPSPTGTLPPAVTEVASAGPPDAAPQAGHDSYDIVSPEAETTPMAVILGDQPPRTGRAPAEPAAGDAASRRGESVPPSEGSGDRREAGQAGRARATPQPPVQRIRGPFEPLAKSDPVEPHAPPDKAHETGQAGSAAGTTMSQAARASVWAPATSKMDQIKDLYLTAEAIGEDALDKHFELVSDRQRQLIKEYFNGAVASGAESSDAAS